MERPVIHPKISAALLKASSDWARDIVEPLDHSIGHQWSASVLPNNYLFYLRTEEERMRPTNVGANLHSAHEFVVSLAGEGWLCLEKEVYHIAPGDAFLVKPGEFHHYFGFNSRPFAWLLFKFDLGKEASATLQGAAVCKLLGEDMVLLNETGRAHNEKVATERNLYDVAARMGELLEKLALRPRKESVGTVNDSEFQNYMLLQRIARFVLDHIDQAIRIQDLANYLEVSESNLRKVFREEFEVSLGVYLRQTRFARGVQLLRGTQMNISEIAQRSGFESVASFSSAFRKAFGLTPTSYRQQFQDSTLCQSQISSSTKTVLLRPEFFA